MTFFIIADPFRNFDLFQNYWFFVWNCRPFSKNFNFFKIVGLFRNCWPLSKLLTFSQNFRLHRMVLKYIICRIVKTVEMNHIRIESTPPPGWMELQQFMIEWSTRDIPAGIITSLSWHNRQSTLFNPLTATGRNYTS